MPKPREVDGEVRVTRDKLNILMETFYKEVEKLRDQALQVSTPNCFFPCRKLLVSLPFVLCKWLLSSVNGGVAFLFLEEKEDLPFSSSKGPSYHCEIITVRDRITISQRFFKLNF